MRVLIITTHLNTGGIGIYTTNLARYLAKRNIEVTVASSGGELLGRLLDNNIKHIDLDIRTKASFGIKTWKAVPKVLRMVRENNIDVIHAQTRVSQVVSCVVSKLSKVPYVTTCHGFFKHQRLGRRIFPCWGDKSIAISKSVEEHLVKDFNVLRENVSMIYNGIETDRYREKRGKDPELMRKLGLGDDDFIIGSVGRHSPVKGYKYLIGAFKDVLDKHREAKLLLVGDGPEKNSLIKRVKELDIRESVIITPGGDEAIEKYYALIDIFCLPSLHEGLGLSLMEAMASGNSCVATNVGGLKELIEDGEDGLLVRKENYGVLSDTILRLMENESLREKIASCAREKALNNFSMEENIAKTIEVYKEVTT